MQRSVQKFKGKAIGFLSRPLRFIEFVQLVRSRTLGVMDKVITADWPYLGVSRLVGSSLN